MRRERHLRARGRQGDGLCVGRNIAVRPALSTFIQPLLACVSEALSRLELSLFQFHVSPSAGDQAKHTRRHFDARSRAARSGTSLLLLSCVATEATVYTMVDTSRISNIEYAGRGGEREPAPRAAPSAPRTGDAPPGPRLRAELAVALRASPRPRRATPRHSRLEMSLYLHMYTVYRVYPPLQSQKKGFLIQATCR